MRRATGIWLSDSHRVQVTRDQRDGTVYVRLRRHKRGKTVSFTADEWHVLISRAEQIEQLISAATS